MNVIDTKEKCETYLFIANKLCSSTGISLRGKEIAFPVPSNVLFYFVQYDDLVQISIEIDIAQSSTA